MKSVVVVCLLITGTILGLATRTEATRILPMDAQKLGQTATTVVQGRVSSIHSSWNASHTKVFTETTIAVDETFKGDPGSEVTLVQLGGDVDGIRVTVHGALHWTQGEEVLLFLEPYPNGKYQVTGFSQGKYHIERDEATGRAFVRQADLGGAEMHDEDSEVHKARMTAAKRVPLEQLLAQALPQIENQGQR